MNAADRDDMKKLGVKIDELINQTSTLTPDEAKALRELAEIAPTLTSLAKAWESAAWFASVIKWLGALGAGLAAIVVAFQIFTGDGKP